MMMRTANAAEVNQGDRTRQIVVEASRAAGVEAYGRLGPG
jgi:hypothetical protein